MKCPNCNETLVMSERQSVEIDYCPKCRGVWLDRGELDKIVEKSASYTDKDYDDDRSYDDRKNYPTQGGHYNDPHNKKKKRKGFLGDMFDFD